MAGGVLPPPARPEMERDILPRRPELSLRLDEWHSLLRSSKCFLGPRPQRLCAGHGGPTARAPSLGGWLLPPGL